VAIDALAAAVAEGPLGPAAKPGATMETYRLFLPQESPLLQALREAIQAGRRVADGRPW